MELLTPVEKAENIIRSMMQYARSDTGQRQLTNINALLEEAVQLAHSRRSLDRSFNVTIYTEYESAIALSEVAFSIDHPRFYKYP
jgi:signal transduction histidine kinase